MALNPTPRKSRKPKRQVTCPECSTTFTPPTPEYHAKGGRVSGIKKGLAFPHVQEKAAAAKAAKAAKAAAAKAAAQHDTRQGGLEL